MDRRQAFDKNEADNGSLAKRDTLEHDENSAADSWFKERLHYVRSELRKEMRTKFVPVAKQK